ncbi:MAG: TolC family protein [Syntrophales bacterium]|nr:TolC family protein [Syntrophales bacterium]
MGALIFSPGRGCPQEPRKGLTLLQAVGLTVSLQPNILMQREQVQNQAGVLQQNTGKFDLAVKGSVEKKVEKTPLTKDQQESYGNLITEYDQDTLTTTVGLEKQFRTGIKIGPNMKVYRSGSNLDNFFEFNTVPDNYSTFNFTLEVPLLKGFGQDVAGADEKAAGVNLEATRLDLTQTVSQSVLTTVQAYWSYLAAKKKLGIYRESEGSASQLVDNLQQLVAAKENPVTDLVQSQASLAEKTALRISAEQQLLEARKNLGLAMGLKSREVLALPLPKDSYPEPLSGMTETLEGEKDKYLQLAEKYRADLLALKEKEKAAQILLVAAQKNLKPQLNAVLGLGYGGLQESGNFRDYLNAVNHNTVGLNYSAALMFKYPLGNNTAEGVAGQKLAQRRQSHIQTVDLHRKIRANVLVTLEALKRYSAGLKKAREAVTLYRRGYTDENLRFRMGMSTIIDLITVQNRLSTAMVTEVDSQLDYANAVIKLRYETGTLIVKEKEQYRVEMKRLIAIPDANGAS